ncbi:mechanosensitive ion channel family protein [Phocaeicola coprocola]|jgi:miniconductance mechanosensitive channel|uniref:mechanosensitive ion channel family protein n=1 Tax=Phocaeicola coprocola TaxID=310298 RepID=UPI001C389200|nr:mechanosensitive ion channel domain-containing protein [Phocaeicola coprocola]MBV3868071.1 mechanosensitive ion channel family protein [Phocaeicola coprocola]MBV4009223.1 mechanosensitive ion channel family protein [Phocaeicola coprocola]MBV4033716.1 mechanosensitive ion channel family protein [Phocaeicola coprocola]MBV4040296.1 mechanosensitive ion channel family protein [Phocaeicola coprocola]MBV4061890.1 mechanosensitive ion channel family protein [Phocaeicola coprocola]
MEDLYVEIAQQLSDMGIDKENLSWSTRLTLVALILLISYIMTKLFRHLVIPAVHKITSRTKATWDDYLFNEKMMTSFCRMIPPIMFYLLLPFVFNNVPQVLDILLKGCLIYLVITTLMLVNSFLNSLYEISNEHETLRNRPLKGIYQMINLVAIGIGIILIISILIDQNAATILAGLGASAAVLMLIFKDSILGLVAGVQLSANDMLRPGDWITMPKYGADGDVLEVSLTTVKVRNFDKTITTIPPYALVSDSFQNWRGMRETGGRRIKRSIFIDMTTVHFCSEREKEMFASRGWIDEAQAKPETQVVNLYVFRNYLQNYLKEHPRTHKELMIMVRQMQPTSEGLPLEIYCFSNTTVWPEYEQIQGEIFDHILAVIPEFGLRIFQRPSGNDLTNTVSL